MHMRPTRVYSNQWNTIMPRLISFWLWKEKRSCRLKQSQNSSKHTAELFYQDKHTVTDQTQWCLQYFFISVMIYAVFYCRRSGHRQRLSITCVYKTPYEGLSTLQPNSTPANREIMKFILEDGCEMTKKQRLLCCAASDATRLTSRIAHRVSSAAAPWLFIRSCISAPRHRVNKCCQDGGFIALNPWCSRQEHEHDARRREQRQHLRCGFSARSALEQQSNWFPLVKK